MKKYIAILFLISFLPSCQSRIIYDKYQALEHEIWEHNQVLDFNTNIQESGLYIISLHIRYTYDIETENIWCIVNGRNGSIQQLYDTINIQIATDNGHIPREGGPLKTIEQTILKNPISLPKGNILFRLSHGLPIDIKGIKDVGICIKKQ